MTTILRTYFWKCSQTQPLTTFFCLPKASVFSWTDLKTKFIMQYVGERQFLKDVGYLNDVYQRQTESLANYYNHFNRNLTKIDHVIIEWEIVQAFVRVMVLKGQAVKHTFRVTPAYNLEELAERVKDNIDVEQLE